MATIVLQAAGTALGTALGGPIGGMIGGAIGAAIGGVADSYILGALFPPKTIRQEGPRLQGVHIQSSQEGSGIKRVFGRVRLAGEMIWSTRFREVVTTTTEKVGGKGGGGTQKVSTTTYSYYGNFAVALCQGPILGIGQIWADAKPMDLSEVTYRLYTGTETQNPDPKIAATEGVAFTPAYRGVAYIVFEELLLEKFGNRLPQINVEVFCRASPTVTGDEVEEKIKAVTMIPALGEFAYATSKITDTSGTGAGGNSTGWAGATTSDGDKILNTNAARGGVDFINSVADLKMVMTGVDNVALVCSWHFTDLRAGNCEIRPKVEDAVKVTTPYLWQVSGLTRAAAQIAPQDVNGALLGGAPSDRSVFEAIQHLNAQGYKVTMYPFIIGDPDSSNTLLNPYNGYNSQPTFPWRGRITCTPSPYNHNLLTNTHNLSGWVNAGSTPLTTGLADPFGGFEAFTITDNSNTVQQFIYKWFTGTFSLNERIFFSVYIKQGTGNSRINFYSVISGTHGESFDVNKATGTYTHGSFGTGNVLHSSRIDTIVVTGITWYRLVAIMSNSVILPEPCILISGADYAVPAALGEVTCFGPQISRSRVELPYYRNATGTAVDKVDTTATAATQVNTFVGSTLVSHVGTWNGDTIPFTGSGSDWSYRRMILHYAKLAAAAGGVDAFLVGSELVELTRIRGASNSFPMVDALKTLAADVSTILPGACKVGYAANWDEYHSHRPGDGTGDIYFNMDPLWSDANIDFIGIDFYAPLSDWRDTPNHLDGVIYDSIYSVDYLKANIGAGEFADWFYASQADRDNQIRTSITDGTYGKPWVYANKRVKDWWLNQHFNRPLGVESGSATSWVAQSKPVWLTEYGCPAVDKGSNQPNVFVDPKSSESSYPYYSTQARDALIQRQYYEAMLSYWAEVVNNPISSVYSAPMLDMNNIYAWSCVSRPYPEFPKRDAIWRDGENWIKGHWLTGRMSMVSVDKIVKALTVDLPVTTDLSGIYGIVHGFVIERIMTPRAAIEGLATAFFFDAFESEGKIKFAHRARKPQITISADNLVDDGSEAGPFTLTRAQETELPLEASFQFLDADTAYEVGSVLSRRTQSSITTERVATAETSAVLDRDDAQQISDILLMDIWVQRERFGAIFPPSLLKLDPSDIIAMTLNGREFEFRIDEIGYEYTRGARGMRTDRNTYYKVPVTVSKSAYSLFNNPVSGVIDFLDLPIMGIIDREYAPWIALYANPWVSFNVFKSTSTNFTLDSAVLTPSVVGTIQNAVQPGVTGVWDLKNKVTVKLLSTDVLQSLDDLSVFEGANTAAMKGTNGEWEVFQWRTANLVAANTYELSGLLRAQLGSEGAMNSVIPASSGFVLLTNITQSGVTSTHFKVALNWKFGPASKDIGDDTYRQVVFTPQGINLRPLSPTDLNAVRDSGGVLTLSWIRRDRKDADNWEQIEIPMSEASEKYDIEILDSGGTVVVRTVVDHTSTTFTYNTGLQTADHGGTITTVRFRVYQKSAVYGRGQVRSAVIIT